MHVLSEQIIVSPQPTLAELESLPAQGIEQIISNRPDDEDPSQVPFAEMAAAAEKLGIAAYDFPVSGGTFPKSVIAQVAETLANGKKTLMYCRTGTRSTIIWAAIRASQGEDLDSLIDRAAEAGYGIGQLRDFLAEFQP